ncbi:hypothetical protein [Streptomyces chartreusis]|uniref:hypothetical protein n=1 Tax=Streptomyces chartreusis TaxID=1969 RepID=UPI003669E430
MTSLRFDSYAQPTVNATLGGAAPGAVRPKLIPQLKLTGAPDGEATPVTGPALSVVGPEHVIGVDPGLFGRRTPAPGVIDAVSNDLVSVDVLAVDLPWRFTPRPADPDGRLRPWMVLVVVEAAQSRLEAGAPLPVLLTHRRELPDLAESWAWAHVQSAVADTPDAQAMPQAEIARLICPRQLKSDGTPYIAAVVPAFRAGREVGTRSPVSPANALDDAWTVSNPGDQPDDTVKLPVYLAWEFITGQLGDFEELAARIIPLEDTETEGFGSRPVDVSQPWPDTEPDPEHADAEVQVEGALRDITAMDDDSPPPEVTDLREALADAVNAGAERAPDHQQQRPGALAPPLYGGPPAGRDTVDAEDDEEDWLHGLNLDLRHRLAAGLGAEFVRRNQEELMAHAWTYAGAIRETNRARAQGRLAERVAASLHRRHVATLTPAELIGLTAPARNRVRSVTEGTEGVTAAAELHVSRLTDGFASTAWARLTRPSGPAARHAVAPAEAFAGAADRMPPDVPRTVALGRALTDGLATRGLAGATSVPVTGSVVDEVPAPPDTPVGGQVARQVAAAAAAEDRLRATRSLSSLEVVRMVAAANEYTGAEAAIDETLGTLPFRTSLLAANTGDAVFTLADTGMATMAAESLKSTIAALEEGTVLSEEGALSFHQGCGPDVAAAGVRVDAEPFRDRVAYALSPEGLVGLRLSERLAVPSAMGDPQGTEEVMPAPEFPVPMAMALLADTPEWFLPGLSAFPPERARLLAANAPFIESYLIGLCHEMNRELLWREFPTDRRGTPFQRFWPQVAGSLDLPPLDSFDDGPLGSHLSPDTRESVILLVRAELLRRHPQTLLFMVPALAADDGSPEGLDPDPTHWSPPLFALPVDASTTAFAFRGAPDDIVGPPGAFFVFQENAYQLRFGFDMTEIPLRTWNDLSWPLVLDGRGFASARRPVIKPSSAAPTDPVWGVDAAQTAAIALQRPVRVVRHASELVRR